MGTEKSPGPRSSRSPATSPPRASTRRRWAPRCASCSSWPAACRAGHELKFWTPGGSSTPLLTAEHLDVPLDFESVAAAGSMLGTSALMIFDETDLRGPCGLRWTEFYEHESCGKCTPCREGTVLAGADPAPDGARPGHRRRTWTPCSTSATTSSAARSARSATAPPARSPRPLQYFRDEFDEHICGGGCPLRPGGARRSSGRTDDPGDLTAGQTQPAPTTVDRHHRRRRAQRAQGHAGDPGRRAARHRRSPGSATTRCSTRSAPAGSAWSRSSRPAQAAGRPAPPRSPTAWSSRPSSPPRWPRRRSRAPWRCC